MSCITRTDFRCRYASLLRVTLIGLLLVEMTRSGLAGSLTDTSVTLGESPAAEVAANGFASATETEADTDTDARRDASAVHATERDTETSQIGIAEAAATATPRSSESTLDQDSSEAGSASTGVPDERTEPSPSDLPPWWQKLIDPQRVASTAQLAATMTALGLLPAVVMLTTSYVRISVVLAVLLQARGVQKLLPPQVSMSLAMFCTALVMWPTWTVVHQEVVEPWQVGGPPSDWALVSQQAMQPVREFMVRQIDTHKNWDDIHLFMKYAAEGSQYPATFEDVPLRVLFPAYLLSELKTAFLIGFQIYLPFLVIDLVIAAVTTSMGMFMLAPTTVALPLKLLLFVIVDGWRLVIDMLLQSFK